jgi:hypothetical protein
VLALTARPPAAPCDRGVVPHPLGALGDCPACITSLWERRQRGDEEARRLIEQLEAGPGLVLMPLDRDVYGTPELREDAHG